jgi:hypothetical protein
MTSYEPERIFCKCCYFSWQILPMAFFVSCLLIGYLVLCLCHLQFFVLITSQRTKLDCDTMKVEKLFWMRAISCVGAVTFVAVCVIPLISKPIPRGKHCSRWAVRTVLSPLTAVTNLRVIILRIRWIPHRYIINQLTLLTTVMKQTHVSELDSLHPCKWIHCQSTWRVPCLLPFHQILLLAECEFFTSCRAVCM